jgi:hypothetical protein
VSFANLADFLAPAFITSPNSVSLCEGKPEDGRIRDYSRPSGRLVQKFILTAEYEANPKHF